MFIVYLQFFVKVINKVKNTIDVEYVSVDDVGLGSTTLKQPPKSYNMQY